MQIGEAFHYPALMAPVGDILQRGEPARALISVRRNGMSHELELRPPVGVRDPAGLGVEDVAPSRRLSHWQFERQTRVIGKGISS